MNMPRWIEIKKILLLTIRNPQWQTTHIKYLGMIRLVKHVGNESESQKFWNRKFWCEYYAWCDIGASVHQPLGIDVVIIFLLEVFVEILL